MHLSESRIASPAATGEGRWLLPAVILSGLASFVHVLATPEHFEEWIGYGLFFLTMAAAQAVYALALVFRVPAGRPLLMAGIVGNAAIIAVYLVTRTIGIPWFGPEAGEVEAIGQLDIVSKVIEGALITCLAMAWRQSARPSGRPSVGGPA